jgi:hypothetical protein
MSFPTGPRPLAKQVPSTDFNLSGVVLMVFHDGFRIIDPKGKDQLWFSFEALNIDLGTSLNK